MNQVINYDGWREENFFYSTGWSDPMTAIAQTVNSQIEIASDSVFKAYYFTLAVRQGAAGSELLVVNWAGDVQINDSSIGKNFFNVPTPVLAIQGNGELPYNVAPPRIFASQVTMVIAFTSNVATRTEAHLTIHGAKLFPIGR